MGKLIDRIGKVYGRLTVLQREGTDPRGSPLYQCKCECGRELVVSSNNLGRGSTSCGKCWKVDRTNERYGKLVVLRYSHNQNGQAYWECQCDCGNKKITSGHALHAFRNNRGGVGSCGCLHAETHFVRRLDDKLAGLNKIFTHYKQGAKKRGLSFKLTKEEFKNFVEKRCYYCNCPPKMIAHPSKRKSKDPLLYNGIDRVDNSLGYQIDNCVPCCKDCNNAKNTRTIDEFLEWIHNVYKTSYVISQRKTE